jgi:hypothetical protein
MTANMKRLSSEKSTSRLRDVDKEHLEQKIETAQNFDQVRERFRHAHAYETH